MSKMIDVLKARCSYCNGKGRLPFERDRDGWAFSWISCRHCNGTGKAR